MAQVVAAEIIDQVLESDWYESDKEYWVKSEGGSVLVVSDGNQCFVVAAHFCQPALREKVRALLALVEDGEPEIDLCQEPKDVALQLAAKL